MLLNKQLSIFKINVIIRDVPEKGFLFPAGSRK